MEMRTRILRLVSGAAIAFSIASGGAGVVSADWVLATTKGCTDYIDSHGHITTVCRAQVDTDVALEARTDEAARQ
jgi:hypothetical protein